MNIVVVTALVVLALVAFGLLLLVRSQRQTVSNLDELAGKARAVDMPALHNLIDPEETRFLQQTLSPAQFRTLQRERTLAAAEYVRNISHNASLLIQLGQLARVNPDPQLAESARLMVERAAHVRLMSTLVLGKLYLQSLLPNLPFVAEDIAHDYRALTETAVLFTRLQRPAFAGRVSAML
jgi:hypothetical protein